LYAAADSPDFATAVSSRLRCVFGELGFSPKPASMLSISVLGVWGLARAGRPLRSAGVDIQDSARVAETVSTSALDASVCDARHGGLLPLVLVVCVSS